MWAYWPPYVTVAEKKKESSKVIKKLLKSNPKIQPVYLQGSVISKSFWGKAWCKHLNSFADHISRLERGRSYVRTGVVVHLEITKSLVKSMVQGSSLYRVEIKINPLEAKKWQDIADNCSSSIGSVIELLKGKLSSEVMKIITDNKSGLFPLAREISFSCNCPDSAMMCKHIAATLYGVGARLDLEPELLFTLRNVNHLDLVQKTIKPQQSKIRSKVLKTKDLSALFEIDVES